MNFIPILIVRPSSWAYFTVEKRKKTSISKFHPGVARFFLGILVFHGRLSVVFTFGISSTTSYHRTSEDKREPLPCDLSGKHSTSFYSPQLTNKSKECPDPWADSEQAREFARFGLPK